MKHVSLILIICSFVIDISCSKEECPIIVPEHDTIMLHDTIFMYDTLVDIDTLILYDTLYQEDSILIVDTVLYSYECDTSVCHYNSICLDTSFYNPINVSDLYFTWTFLGFLEKDNSCLLRSNPDENAYNEPFIVFYENGRVDGRYVFNVFESNFSIDGASLSIDRAFSTDGPEGKYGMEFSRALSEINPGSIKIEGDNLFLHANSKILVFVKK